MFDAALSSAPATRLDGPALFFGGPYSNREATEALLREAARRGIPGERIVCTGDVVAYGADAQPTVDLVRSAGMLVVMGNCEESLASEEADCGCGFTPGSVCEELSARWFSHAQATLDPSARAWMAGLPRSLLVELGPYRLLVVHGAPRRINEFVFASTDSGAKAEALAAAGVDGIIGGHSGLPFTESVAGRLWHNPGAIGMPANDGTARGWFSIVNPLADGLAIEHAAFDYDHAGAADRMRGVGLPEGYANALSSGLWPSCDVLPAEELRDGGTALLPGRVVWRPGEAAGALWPRPSRHPLDPAKFRDLDRTAAGEARAEVALERLDTLWINTGTLCNIACAHCYIESSPRNDRLAYITLDEVRIYLDEIAEHRLGTVEIGLTGGEPFMNPDILAILEECLVRGFRVLVLTNAMRPMQRLGDRLLDLRRRFGSRLALRVSLDHFTAERHEQERGERTWQPTLDGLRWLSQNGFEPSVAGRTLWRDGDRAVRAGFARLFEASGIAIDAADPAALVLFPEMDETVDVAEVTQRHWTGLGRARPDVMCASSRMVVKRKGAASPSVLACTLLPYDPRFELGTTLAEAARPVKLGHPHCARFCVFGGGACTR